MQNGEYRIVVHGIEHWCRVAGAEHNTVPLVAIHGGPGGHHWNFERTIGPLLESFSTVLYYEQRGCGRSGKPADPADYSIPGLIADLEALREQMGLEQIIPLGYSFGGYLALAYALAHPTRVARVIASAPMGEDPVRGANTQLYGFLQVAEGEIKERVRELVLADGPAPERLNRVWGLVDSATVDRFLFHNQETARLNRKLWQESPLRNTGDMHRALLARQTDPHWMDSLRLIQVPTLVACGLYDRNVGVELCRDVAEAIPDAKLEVFPRSAHFPDMEEPEAFSAAIRAFLS